MNNCLAVNRPTAHGRAATWLAAFLALCLVGCVQTKTTPGYARAGDHIVIGLGGAERNLGGATVLKAADLSIVLTDANDVQHTLEARFIFRSFADYASQMTTYTMDGTLDDVGLSGMVPYDGGWFVVSPLTTPGNYNNPLPLAVGPATIAVTSAKLTNTAGALEGDLSAIPIEIIAGTSPQDTDFTRQFTGYKADPDRFFITPDDLTGITEVGGAFLVVEYNDESFFDEGIAPTVVPLNHNPYVQLSYNVVPNGDGTGRIYVTLINPAGFTTPAGASPNSSLLSDLGVQLVYFPTGSAAQAKTVFSLDLVASYYMDINGFPLGSVAPVLTHVQDL
ncbi:MAG: hypothetical protein CME59_13990 [Halioglobus sp.]|nr:hypothetical protein [Halioglobus sp.]|tara:strand:- start:2964 stop:3968 length:1005 start_codon:yes stop_codon:yes gene_type:complete